MKNCVRIVVNAMVVTIRLTNIWDMSGCCGPYSVYVPGHVSSVIGVRIVVVFIMMGINAIANRRISMLSTIRIWFASLLLTRPLEM